MNQATFLRAGAIVAVSAALGALVVGLTATCTNPESEPFPYGLVAPFEPLPETRPATLDADQAVEGDEWQLVVNELTELALLRRWQQPHELARIRELIERIRDLADPARVDDLDARLSRIERYLVAMARAHQAALEQAR